MIFKRLKHFSKVAALILGLCLSVFLGTRGLCADSKVIVVASTSWTGAIARAAGADEVRILAPLELKHPPEYDYRPADIAKLKDAGAFVYAGYEPFAKKLLEASGFPQNKVFTVVTTNEPGILKQQAKILADKLGTQAGEAEWETRFNRITADILKQAGQKKISQIKVLVQQHQQPFAKWLGYNIVGVFGAEEMSPAKVMEYANLKPDLVIDNFHNPQGKPIVEVAKCKYVELINFPSVKAPTLIDLFKENAARLGL
jgi:zinc transport system substrate-binding protein/iron/zinc/copper transport system substrate-binding protein